MAVGLLTQQDVDLLGPAFNRLWQVDDTPCFSQLLKAIDESENELGRNPKPVRKAVPPEPGRR